MTPYLGTDATLRPLAADLAATALALARRFSSGATLWCWAPGADEHAHHVAVEFVHPVIMGKRALPAVAVKDEASVLATLRSLVRPGDVMLVVGSRADDARVHAALRRAPAWGATTIWIGAGTRPVGGVADHVLWSPGDTWNSGEDPLASHDGRFVVVYHLLWELAHVCFEHAGLLSDDTVAVGTSCVTCADEGRLAEVIEVLGACATVRTAAGVEAVDITVLDRVDPGDLLLVHAGTALTILDEQP